MEIIKYNKIDLSKINYTEPTNQQNSYYGSIDYNKQVFAIQTSRLTIIDVKDKIIQVSVDPNDFSFYDMVVKLDDHNLASTYKYSKEWFKKELPMDVLENMYRRMSKPFKKGEVPLLDLKLSVKPKCLVYDISNKEIDINDIVKDSTIIGILNIKGLKFLKRDYYCEMYLSQIKITNSIEKPISNKCLIEDDINDNNIYDYEIFDEEVINKTKEKNELMKQVDTIKNIIENHKKDLSLLQEKLKNLN
jgi:hypothetical protein